MGASLYASLQRLPEGAPTCMHAGVRAAESNGDSSRKLGISFLIIRTRRFVQQEVLGFTLSPSFARGPRAHIAVANCS